MYMYTPSNENSLNRSSIFVTSLKEKNIKLNFIFPRTTCNLFIHTISNIMSEKTIAFQIIKLTVGHTLQEKENYSINLLQDRELKTLTLEFFVKKKLFNVHFPCKIFRNIFYKAKVAEALVL